MKLELEKNIVLEGLFEELDFSGFLSFFDLDMPLLPYKILRPLNFEEGTAHFKDLSDIQKQIDQGRLELEKVIDQSRKSPILDFLLPFLENHTLEPFHLYSLGKFVSEDQFLQELERNYPVAFETSGSCRDIEAILNLYTQKHFSILNFTPEEKDLQKQIETLENRLKRMLSEYEEEIYKQTGLKMIYPYPKELDVRPENISKIEYCELLSVESSQNACMVNYNLTPSIQALLDEKERLSGNFSSLIQKKLKKINQELKPFSQAFASYYQERKKRAFYYILLWAKNNYSLCLPEFRAGCGCELKDGILPSLQKQKKDKYIPLTLSLNRGSNLLFGANMSGKTTVLKTLYFHLTAIRLGLPVPAGSIQLHYPKQVEIHLKSPGDIRWSLSSFGDEINFFTKAIVPFAYILVDELFQSTDPVSGTELCRIFLEEFSPKEIIFFCTSHYPGVLDLKDISLFRMKDLEFNQSDLSNQEMKNISFIDLLEKVPYKIERIPPDKIGAALKERRKPLSIALGFPLPESIKKRSACI